MHCKKWYEHHPEPVTVGHEIIILYNFIIHTHRYMKANRQDIIIAKKTKTKLLLINMVVSLDKNMSVEEFDKINKCKNHEIEKHWYLKITVIPIIIGALI